MTEYNHFVQQCLDEVLFNVCVATVHRICTESEATKTLYSEVTSPVQSLVVGHVSVLRVHDLLTDSYQHHLLGHEGDLFLLPVLAHLS